MSRAFALCAVWAAIAAIGAASFGRSDDDPTYTEDIRPLFAKKCTPCHQAGGPSPFSLTAYADVKKRASLIRWVLIAGAMPPTDAASDFGPMACCPPLSDQELVTIQEWVRSGTKKGPDKPEPGPAAAPWTIAQANERLFPNRPGTVKAEGAPYRRLLVIDPHWTDDRAIEAFDLKPKTPIAVRQAYLFVLTKEQSAGDLVKPTGIDGKALVGAWAPGHFAWRSRRGFVVHPGDSLVVWALYQPTGKEEDAGFQLDLRVGAPGSGPAWTKLGNEDFKIPPGDGFTTLQAETTLAEARDVIAIVPESRLFARQIRVMAHLPDGKQKRILTVFSWDPNWVGAYNPAEPIALPAGTRVVAEIAYDNSGHSTGNREERPSTPVRFGPDERDELFWVHLQTVPHVP